MAGPFQLVEQMNLVRGRVTDSSATHGVPPVAVAMRKPIRDPLGRRFANLQGPSRQHPLCASKAASSLSLQITDLQGNPPSRHLA